MQLKMENVQNPIGIAVIGMSCRFPGVSDPDEFWDCLKEKRDMIRHIPLDRPYLSRKGIDFEGGFLPCPIDSFDAHFFGFSRREAPFVDPQQRVLLEVSWEALENSGINPHSLKGSSTGVFVGIWQQDYDRMLPESCFRFDDFHRKWMCNAFSAAASRLSNILGLNGPSLPVEAACASSLAAIHLACESLRHGESDLAIASGVNLILDDTFTTALKGSSILSPDFRCKTFDATANGYVRSEGCGVVILKRVDDAIKDGDPILGVILGSAINSDGAGTGFGTPNPLSQARVFNSALEMAGVPPSEVGYVEAHGTGTRVGDPAEVKACHLVYANEEGRTSKLVIGSVKGNIGHCEAAAGIASLIKILLCFKHSQIPPQIHLKNLNPEIAPLLDEIPAEIPLESIQWGGPGRVAVANTFGMTGTNVAVVLRDPANLQRPPAPPTGLPHLLVLSAKSKVALRQLQGSYASFLSKVHPDDPTINLDSIAYTASTGRAHFPDRMTILAKDLTQLRQELAKDQPISEGGKERKKVAFLFPGQGSQYFRMGQGLYLTSGTFRAEFQRVDDAFKSHFGVSLATVLWTIPDFLDSTLYCQPAIFCVQVALVKFWERLGLTPDVVLGHSLGEFAAAVTAGVVSFEDGLKMVVGRSRLLNKLPPGAMLSLSIEAKTLAALMEEFKKVDANWVDVAALNSPTDVVVSGPHKAIEAFAQLCANNGIKVTSLKASKAFHSRDIDEILDPYEEILSKVSAHPPRCSYISGVSGELESEFEMSYWMDHVRLPVQFSSSIQTLKSTGCQVLVEVGTQPVLLGLTTKNLGQMPNSVYCPTLRRTVDNRQSVLETLDKLYRNGIDVEWNSWFDQPCHKVLLPTYPFQRQRFWIEEQSSASSGSSRPGNSADLPVEHVLLGRHVTRDLTENRFQQTINLNQPPFVFFKDHKIGGKLIFPAAGFLEMVLGSGKVLFPQGMFTVKDFVLEFAVSTEMEAMLETRLRLVPTSNSFQLKVEILQKTGQDYQRCVSASLVPTSSPGDSDVARNLNFLRSDLFFEDVAEGVHSEFFKLGYTFKSEFQSISSFWCNRAGREVWTEINRPRNSDDFVCHPLLADAMIQTAVYSLIRFQGLNKLALPIKFTTFTWFRKSTSARLFMRTSWAKFGDISLYNDSGELLARMEGLDFHYVTPESFIRTIESRKPSPSRAELYTQIWEKKEDSKIGSPAEPQNKSGKSWVVISNGESEISGILPNFEEIGGKLVVAQLFRSAGVRRMGIGAGNFKVVSEDPAEDLVKFIANIPNLETILYVDFENEVLNDEIHALRIQGMLNFAQSVINLNLGSQVSIVGVTRSVFEVARSVPNSSTATVQGFFKAFRTEHPELKIYSLDVDVSPETRAILPGLIQNWNPAEPIQAVRNGAVYVPRMARMEIQSGTGRLFRSEATYLVTGGTKGIGLVVVQWMVSKGAKNVVITSRNPPDASGEKIIEDLRAAHDCQIEFIPANVGDFEDCRNLLNAISTRAFPKLAGVFHSAGILQDGLIPNQNLLTFTKSFQPKVLGAWNLHTLTTDGAYNLDYFVLFSSIVSLIGNVGQSNYISANQFLDTLASFRVSLGLPGLSINWGPWSEVGMANNSRMGQKGALGLSPISNASGIEALERILGLKMAQVAVVGSGTNFGQIQQILPLGNYLTDLVQNGTPSPTAVVDEVQSELGSLEKEIKSGRALTEETIRTYVEMLIRHTLRLSPKEKLEADQHFTEFGMDSLMSVEVRGHLLNLLKHRNPGVGVSMSLVQENNTLRTLSTFVINNLGNLANSDDLRQLADRDSHLPDDVTCGGGKLPTSDWKHIFVTGATGFVGAHFVSFLNGRGLATSCLVRGVKTDEEGRAKLEAAFRKFELWDTLDMSLVDVVPGDITSKTLGLRSDRYAELSLKMDGVVHCSALVNHIDEYATGGLSSLRTINVHGLVNLLRFAGNRKIKPVLYPSTLTVATEMDTNGQILDEFPPEGGVAADPLGTFKGGYFLSKFIGEVLLRQAQELGIPSLVLRFPTLLGHSQTGHFPTKYNQFSRLLLSCIRIGRIPDLGRREIPVMAVDEAVRIGGTIFLKEGAELGVYNLTFTGMPTEEDFLDITSRACGVEMSRQSFLDWAREALEGGESLLRPFRDLYEERDGEMPKVTRWNILYTKLIAAKLGVTSGKLLRGIGDTEGFISKGKVILQRHLDYVRKSQPGLLPIRMPQPDQLVQHSSL